MDHDISQQPTNIICLSEARRSYKKCGHKNMTVDAELSELVCDDCGDRLNPIAILVRFSHEESRWKWQRDALMEERERIEAKSKCKCQHCGKITKITRR